MLNINSSKQGRFAESLIGSLLGMLNINSSKHEAFKKMFDSMFARYVKY